MNEINRSYSLHPAETQDTDLSNYPFKDLFLRDGGNVATRPNPSMVDN